MAIFDFWSIGSFFELFEINKMGSKSEYPAI